MSSVPREQREEWRRRGQKPNLYCHLLAQQATSQHSPDDCERLELHNSSVLFMSGYAVRSYIKLCILHLLILLIEPKMFLHRQDQALGQHPLQCQLLFVIILAEVFGMVFYRRRLTGSRIHNPCSVITNQKV